MQDPLNLYKLIVLYMLHQVEFPLTRVQLFDFILEKGYTTFFVLQQAIAELIDANLVISKAGFNSTRLSLSEQGVTTLSYFENRIPEAIRLEIREYFKENKLDIKNDLSVKSDYYKATNGDFVAHLSIITEAETPVEIKLSVPSEDTAQAICRKWKSKNQEVYAYIMKELL